MSVNEHSAAVTFRAEVMTEQDNTGDAYEARLTEIGDALDLAVKDLGLDALGDNSGRNVVHFRNEEDEVALADSPTGQQVRMLFAQYFVLFRNATRAEVAENMASFRVARPDGTAYRGVSWQFFDPKAFTEQTQSASDKQS